MIQQPDRQSHLQEKLSDIQKFQKQNLSFNFEKRKNIQTGNREVNSISAR